jgi:oxepin-CoA hydrolase / 3-oxo-5,6-dehydrosuberyl-CoA semialdehyde dehydrogenase
LRPAERRGNRAVNLDCFHPRSRALLKIAGENDMKPVALIGSGGLDFGGMLRHARQVGGPALRR